MPSPYIDKLAKETGKSVAELENLWSKAKVIASETFNVAESKFTSKEYSYAVGIVKNMLGLNEEILSPTKFLNSKLSAKDYLDSLIKVKEEVTTSNIGVDIKNVIPPEISNVSKEIAKDDDEKEDIPEDLKNIGLENSDNQVKENVGDGMKVIDDLPLSAEDRIRDYIIFNYQLVQKEVGNDKNKIIDTLAKDIMELEQTDRETIMKVCKELNLI